MVQISGGLHARMRIEEMHAREPRVWARLRGGHTSVSLNFLNMTPQCLRLPWFTRAQQPQSRTVHGDPVVADFRPLLHRRVPAARLL